MSIKNVYSIFGRMYYPAPLERALNTKKTPPQVATRWVNFQQDRLFPNREGPVPNRERPIPNREGPATQRKDPIPKRKG